MAATDSTAADSAATTEPAATGAPATDEASKQTAAPLLETGMPDKPPVVIMGPSGVGKGTLVRRLMAEHPDKFALTVSHTTRAPRTGEEDGVAYMFVERAVMQAAINAGSFLEHAEVHGNLYGTSAAAVQQCAEAGKSALLEIDVQARAPADRCLLMSTPAPSHCI